MVPHFASNRLVDEPCQYTAECLSGLIWLGTCVADVGRGVYSVHPAKQKLGQIDKI